MFFLALRGDELRSFRLSNAEPQPACVELAEAWQEKVARGGEKK